MKKAILFTGATGGLGEASVKALAARGWTVFAAGTNEKKLKALGLIENIIPLKMDVGDMVSIERARETVKKHMDRLDAVANFAGLTAFTPLVEGDAAALIERLLDINVMGTVRVNRVFFDMVLKGGGRIINCSSSAGWMKAQPFAGPYVLSKHALEAYNDSLRRELLFLDIPVIKIQPGSFKTRIADIAEQGFDTTLAQTRYYKKLLTTMKPLMDMIFKSSGEPERVARVVVKAAEAKRPKIKYRVGSNFLLLLMELMPNKTIDWIYRWMYKRGR